MQPVVYNDDGWTIPSVATLPQLQTQALQLCHAHAVPGCLVPLVQALPDSSLRKVVSVVNLDHNIDLNRYFTNPVQARMRAIVGAMEHLCELRASSSLPYRVRVAKCFVCNAHLFPVHSYHVPDHLAAVVVGANGG